MYTMEEQETIIRWDRTNRAAMLYTAAPTEAARWRRLGYSVSPQGPHGWQAEVPKKAVRMRKLVDGALPTRKVSSAFIAGRNRRAETNTGQQGKPEDSSG